jgi:hypothetical protein
MNKLRLITVTTAELSSLLTLSTLEKSSALGDSSIYHILHDGKEKIAISLPDGQAVIIELEVEEQGKRRRIDLTPALNRHQANITNSEKSEASES